MKDDLERKTKFLGKSPALVAWEARRSKGWVTDEEFERAIDRLYRMKKRSLGLKLYGPDPLYSIPNDFGNSETGIMIGNPIHEDIEMPNLYLPMEDLTQCHVGASGRTRYGKTYLLAGLLKQVSEREPHRSFLCIDIQGELAGILANLLSPEKLLWIPVQHYWKNPLQDLHAHGLDKSIGILKRALMESVFIGDLTVNLLEQVIRNRCTAEKLAGLGPPTLYEILQIGKNPGLCRANSQVMSRKLIESQQSMINAVGNLSLNLGFAYNRPISKGFTLTDLEGLVTVIDISAIKDPIAIKFLVVKELLELMLYAEKPHPPMTVVLDELHRFAPLEKRYGQFSDPILVDATKTFLKLGVNFWWAEQNPGMMVNPAIFANTGTHFVFRTPSAKDRWPVLYAINISEREQEQAVGTFEQKQCLVYSDWLGEAALVKTPHLDIENLREEASRRCAPVIKAFHERFLEESPKGASAAGSEADPFEPEEGAEREPRTVQNLTKKRIVEHLAEFSLSGITDTYVAVGVSPEIGKKHLKEMVDLGWVEGPERMPGPGKSHKTNDCYVVTEKGCQSLGIDWQRARLPGKGSLKSRLAAKMIGRHLQGQGKVVRYEHALSSGEITKSSDVAILEEDGRVIGYEYENTNAHLMENITRNAKAGFSGTVVVCPNTRARVKAERIVERELDPGLQGMVTFATLKEFA